MSNIFHKYMKYKQKYLILKGGVGEVSNLLKKHTGSKQDPINLTAAFLVPIWYYNGKYYGIFGIDRKNEITPLGGMREANETATAVAFREFFE